MKNSLGNQRHCALERLTRPRDTAFREQVLSRTGRLLLPPAQPHRDPPGTPALCGAGTQTRSGEMGGCGWLGRPSLPCLFPPEAEAQSLGPLSGPPPRCCSSGCQAWLGSFHRSRQGSMGSHCFLPSHPGRAFELPTAFGTLYKFLHQPPKHPT